MIIILHKTQDYDVNYMMIYWNEEYILHISLSGILYSFICKNTDSPPKIQIFATMKTCVAHKITDWDPKIQFLTMKITDSAHYMLACLELYETGFHVNLKFFHTVFCWVSVPCWTYWTRDSGHIMLLARKYYVKVILQGKYPKL